MLIGGLERDPRADPRGERREDRGRAQECGAGGDGARLGGVAVREIEQIDEAAQPHGAAKVEAAIEAQKAMVGSPNHTVVYIPVGPMGVPITATMEAVTGVPKR